MRYPLALLLAFSVSLISFASASEQPSGHARAQRLLSSGQIERALGAWEEALRQKPEDREMLAALGAVLYADGQFARAVPYLRRASQLDAQDWTLRLFLATALHSAGDKEQAGAEFRAVADGAPNSGTARIASDKLSGDFFRGQEQAERGMWTKLGAEREPGRLWVGLLLPVTWARPNSSLHDEGSLVPLIGAATASRFGDIVTGGDSVLVYGAFSLRAISYAKNRYLLAARAWKGTPEESNIGRVVFRLRFFGFVLEHVRSGSPQAAWASKMQARMAISRRNYRDAAELARAALRLAPHDAEAHQILGSVYVDLGQMPEAGKELQAALTLWPDYSSAHHETGRLALIQDRAKDAVAAFTRAIELDATKGSAYQGLAAAYKALGEAQRAESVLEQARELEPQR